MKSFAGSVLIFLALCLFLAMIALPVYGVTSDVPSEESTLENAIVFNYVGSGFDVHSGRDVEVGDNGIGC